jgi:hypothetical protein
MPHKTIHIGKSSMHATEDVTVQSANGNVVVGAGGANGAVVITGGSATGMQSGAAMFSLKNDGGTTGTAVLTVGTTGQIQLGAGVPLLGAFVKLEPEAVIISCGAPGIGAAIKMTPESITFSVGEVSFTMTPAGIVENVAECSRELTPEGHNFTAGETELNIGVQGFSGAFPTESREAEAGVLHNETMLSHSSDAMRSDDAGILVTV